MLAANGLPPLLVSNRRVCIPWPVFSDLLSTVLLVLIVKQRRPANGLIAILYFAFTLAGLATHVYFWAALCHPSFVGLCQPLCVGTVRHPSLLRLQIFVFIAASPLAGDCGIPKLARVTPPTIQLIPSARRAPVSYNSVLSSKLDPLVISTGFLSTLFIADSRHCLLLLFLFVSLVLRKSKESTHRTQATDRRHSM